MKRQLDDYIRKYYSPLMERSGKLNADNYKLARDIAAWKRNVIRGWDSMQVVSMTIPNPSQKPLMLGQSFEAEIILELNELSGVDIGIEVLFGKKVNNEVLDPILVKELEHVNTENNNVTFTCTIPFTTAGVYDYAFRIFPKNPLLPHRQDLNLVRWI